MTRPGREQDRKSILRVVIVERVDHDLHDPDLHLETQDVAGGVQEELLPAAAGTSLRSASIFLLIATTRFVLDDAGGLRRRRFPLPAFLISFLTFFSSVVLDGLLNRLLAAPAAAAAPATTTTSQQAWAAISKAVAQAGCRIAIHDTTSEY